MQTQTSSLWRLRLVTFALAALAAASAVYWGLKWQNPSAPARVAPIVAQPRAIDSAQVAALLGARPKAATAAPVNTLSNYKLLGVIAQGNRHGSALIAVEGAPAKPYRIGDTVGNDWRLLSVAARSVTLGSGAAGDDGVTLALPPLPGTR